MPRSQVIGSSTFQTTQNRLNQHAPNQHQIPAPPIPPPFLPTFQSVSRVEPSRVVLSSAPKLYSARPTTSSNIPTVELPASALLADTQIHHYDVPTVTQFEPQKVKKTKTEKSAINPMAEDIIRAAKASSALQSYGTKDKKKLDKKTLRIAGGSSWEDNSLADWPEDDFRIFCGDLGNDVNDELLTRTFSKYGSFQRSKVIRDKRTGKSKGYGFISFKEPQDFIRAMKEMDGKFNFFIFFFEHHEL